MQEFIFTSKRFKGSMYFVYNNGILERFENRAELSTEQMHFFEHNFPFRSEYLVHIKGSGDLTEVTDLSFENFWCKYDYKVDKTQAKKYWEKMPRHDKIAALGGIYKYKYQCNMKNTAMIYPIRYLKNRRWEDESN